MIDYLAPQRYLPHEAPMCLLDKVIEVTQETAHCQVKVSADGVLAPFLDRDGTLPGWFAIEIIAQTVGVWSGWHTMNAGEESVGVGMLLGGRGLRCPEGGFPASTVLDCKVTLLMRDEKIGSFEGEILANNRLMASGRVNTYQPDKNELEQLF
ncbi:3-hydroxy-fatty acyl-ACP dehydratase [Enterobacteriaceae bacterium H20N1]|uniref:3-hydroxy-fatty acyl-ACP dehydratase n=1 Tax=Dryocola boscaweniae TaxID=2925397 RepID=A0A9X3AR46_9ENTR|nr:3-hydroxy-fatty acyl-ACP dehydratase [Dryocola boscaweniae]MCT4704270.1 3-hydroxy-fatty acyl-ACP dehydratase [Dryocola boscaweniae]MCT4721438.1 3-hydroxy-fatty acyl-ACP dehydratase [Dryocola boscaweniae]